MHNCGCVTWCPVLCSRLEPPASASQPRLSRRTTWDWGCGWGVALKMHFFRLHPLPRSMGDLRVCVFLKSPNSPVSGSRIQSQAWAITFLVLHGPLLAKTKSSLHSSSSHRWWGDQSEPVHVKEKINQWGMNAQSGRSCM